MRFFASAVLCYTCILSQFVFSAPSVEDYGRLPATSKMVISAEGNKIAFRRFEGQRDTLMIYSLKENKLLRAVDVSDIVPEDIYFISEKQLIIRASEHKKLPGFKGSHDIHAAYALDVSSGKLDQLLRLGDRIYPGQRNIGNIIGVSKDKQYLYMPAVVAQTDHRSFAPRKQTASERTGYAVMKVDLESPKKPAKISRDDSDAIDYFMGKDGEVLVEERYGQHSNRHEVLVKRGSKWKRIYDEKVSRRTISLVGLTPDYKSLVVLTYGENDHRKYHTMSLKDGKISDPGVNSDDHDVASVITDINRIVFGVRYDGLLPSYKFFDKELDKRIKKIRDIFSGNSVSIDSWSNDWKKIVVYVSGSKYPGEYYLFNEKSEPTFLSDSRPKIGNDDVHPIATVVITSRDGLKIPTLLTIPKNKVAEMKSLPAIVMPHGGPRANNSIGFDWIAQAFANEGYLVIQPQFRGSQGFGWEFVEAGFGEWGGKMIDDITDTLDFTISKGMVDKHRVCIVGASYGGYAALASGANLPGKYKCIVSINGIANMVDLLKDDANRLGRYHSAITSLKQYVDPEEASKEKLVSISPYYKAEAFKAPVLLIHGENDDNVKESQSKDFEKRLKKAKKKVTYIRLDDENHYLQKNDSRIKTLKAAVDFVNDNLK